MRRFFILVTLITLSFSNFSCTSDTTEDITLEQTLRADDGDWGGRDLDDEDEN